MAPIGILILLHYYACADDYRGGDFSAPAVRDAIDWFVDTDMLELTNDPETKAPDYRITERGRVYVEALRAVPLPEKRWVVPTSHPGYAVPSMHIPPGPQPDPVTGWRVS